MSLWLLYPMFGAIAGVPIGLVVAFSFVHPYTSMTGEIYFDKPDYAWGAVYWVLSLFAWPLLLTGGLAYVLIRKVGQRFEPKP